MTSKPEKLLPVIQADRDFAAEWIIVVPHNKSTIRAGDWDHHHGVQAVARHRLSSPVSGTDGYVMVPREPTEAMLEAASLTPGMSAVNDAMTMHQVRGYGFDAGAFTNGSPLHQAWSAMLNTAPASPSTPIPVIAEAGERDRVIAALRPLKPERAIRAGDALDLHEVGDAYLGKLADAAIAALSTPATLANTAVEGQS